MGTGVSRCMTIDILHIRCGLDLTIDSFAQDYPALTADLLSLALKK